MLHHFTCVRPAQGSKLRTVQALVDHIMPSRAERLAKEIHRVAGMVYRMPDGHSQLSNGLDALDRLAEQYRDVTGTEAVRLLKSDLEYGGRVLRVLRGTARASRHDWRPGR